MKMKKLFALVTACALSLSLVACGGGEKPAASAPAASTPAASVPAASTPAGTAVREKVSVALSATPTSLDPQVGDLNANKMIWNCTHESLLGIDYQTNTIIPELAKSYEISEDGLTYTFKLNEGVKFHNGEALTAAIKDSITHKDADLKGQMASQGTTPRRLTDLIGSLCDLTSGSGDKGTPIIFIQGYFDNFAKETT